MVWLGGEACVLSVAHRGAKSTERVWVPLEMREETLMLRSGESGEVRVRSVGNYADIW